MELELAGSRALITGGSRGVGLACAHGLAAEGVDLALAARTVGPLKDATRELRDGYPIEITSHSCDVARPDHQRALIDVIGPIDILVNAAGTIPRGDLDLVDDESWRQAWELKIFGTINLCRLLLPAMAARGSGVIVNVFGAAPLGGEVDHVAEAAGASTLEALTRALGASSADDGVRVVGVSVAGGRDGVEARPLADVADVVVFLASSRASMVTGTVVATGLGLGER